MTLDEANDAWFEGTWVVKPPMPTFGRIISMNLDVTPKEAVVTTEVEWFPDGSRELVDFRDLVACS